MSFFHDYSLSFLTANTGNINSDKRNLKLNHIFKISEKWSEMMEDAGRVPCKTAVHDQDCTDNKNSWRCGQQELLNRILRHSRRCDYQMEVF